MTTETKTRRKKWKLAVGILLAVLVLLVGGFFWYVSDYYRAEDVALEVLAGGDHLEVRDDLTILSPSYPTDTAIIFTPGPRWRPPPICPCWTSSGRPASPAFWWRCPSTWLSLM